MPPTNSVPMTASAIKRGARNPKDSRYAAVPGDAEHEELLHRVRNEGSTEERVQEQKSAVHDRPPTKGQAI